MDCKDLGYGDWTALLFMIYMLTSLLEREREERLKSTGENVRGRETGRQAGWLVDRESEKRIEIMGMEQWI